jgi:hypothetical protein
MEGRREAARSAVLVVAVIVIQFLMVSAYAWSATSTSPRDLPVAVTGPTTAVSAVTAELNHADPGAFRVVPAATVDQAISDIKARQAYGAIVLDGRTPRILIAPAASQAAADVLTGLADKMDGIKQAEITDVAPAAAADPTGVGFGFTVLPLMITSIIGGVLISLRIRRVSHRIPGLIAFAAGGGAVTTAVAHTWLGIIPGNFGVLMGATGLAVLAVSATVSGLAHVASHFGRTTVGMVLGSATIMLIGNPFSGMTSAPQMLPSVWGTIGQYLPTGAASTLLRSVAYFDGAGAAHAWTVLAVWAAAGLTLLLTRRRVPAHTPAHAAHAAAAVPTAEDPAKDHALAAWGDRDYV